MKDQHHIQLSRDEEIDIINLCKRDIAHFRPLYEAYHHRILNYIYHKIQDNDLAADLCSQVFLKAMIHIDKYEIQGSPFTAWLYKIAYNETMTYFRKSKKDQTVVLDSQIIEGLQEELDGEDKEQILASLESLMNQLEPKDVELIELRYFEEMSMRQVSQVLNCTEAAAKVRSHRLMMKLKKILKRNRRHEAL